MSATSVLNAVSDAMEVFAELPLHVFDIKITRLEDGRNKIRLTRGAESLEVTGRHGKRIKVTTFLMSSSTNDNTFQIAQCDGLVTVAVPCCFLHSVHEDKPEWKSYDTHYAEPPSAKSIKANQNMIKNVAERILTRFSRVDLL